MSSSRLIVKMGQRPGLSTSVRKDSAWQVPTWDSSSWKDPPPQRGGQGKALLEVRVSPFLRGAHAVSRLRTARPTQDTGRGRAHGAVR